MVITLSTTPDDDTAMKQNGLRPVNLRTDLEPLADLIELVFSDSMDESGRAALREMRYLSKMGPGLNILGRLNDMALGISLGYVWIDDGELIGNVSVYPANWPDNMGDAWIIANVGVHPDYQRRGIARRLMHASMDMIRQRGGKHAILQVDYDNTPAIRLYETLDFIKERAFTTWWRSALSTTPPILHESDVYMTRRRRSEWRLEWQLAQRLRPNQRGGLGWLKPLHINQFNPSWWHRLRHMFSMSHRERLIVRSEDEQSLEAVLWIDSGFATTRTRLTMMIDDQLPDAYAEASVRALLNNVLRRFRTTSLVIEHPHDDQHVNDQLRQYRFRPDRTVWHMRWTIN